MSFDLKCLLSVAPALLALIIWGFVLNKFKLWKKFMDNFKDGVTFECALAALNRERVLDANVLIMDLQK